MEKFAVDLDKVLDDFELQEGNTNIDLIHYFSRKIEIIIFNNSINLDQAEQFVKNAEKCDSVEETRKFHEQNSPELMDFTKTEPLADSINTLKEFPQCSNLVVCEDLESKFTSPNASQTEQEDIVEYPTENKILDTECSVDNPNEHSSLQNELLLDLNEAFDTVLTKDESVYLKIESSTLLDQSFTEDAVTQPLLTNIIIQNGAFNPSHPDTLTDDELESYLAELEKEDEGEISQPTIDVNSGQEASSNHEPSCSPSMSEADKKNSVSNINIVDEEISPVLPITEEVENLPLSDSEITSTEDSNGSSYSDSDSAEVNPQFQEDSLSAEEEMPQLIDDPCLVNSEIVTDIMQSQIIVDDTINAIADQNLPCEESNQEVPSSSKMVDDISGNIAEDLPASLDFHEESNVTSVMSGFSQGDDSLLEPYSSLTEDERLLGVLKPVWIPDEEAPQCMNCSQRFTVIRRRHHCRACGRVLCNNCCSSRARLEYMESTETRVCLPCLQVLRKVEAYKKWGGVTETQISTTVVESGSLGSFDSTSASSPSPYFPNPVVRVNVNNPAEYCSTVPPALQIAAAAALPTPTVMVPTVPVGVLKKEGTPSHPRTKSEPKQVCSLFYI